MNVLELPYEGSRTTSSMLRFTLHALGHPIGMRVTNGLPAGTMRLDRARMIVGATPCTVPLFREAMERVARETGDDVLVVRHGTHPEVLDPVLWDAAIWSGDCVVQLNDLLLYVDPDGYWLVPSRMGAHVRMASDGLHIEAEPGYLTWQQRVAGVCEAARQIIFATAGRQPR